MIEQTTRSKFVNTLLVGETLDDFYTIQRYHGIKTNADVVRFLISQEARRIAADTAATQPHSHARRDD